MADLSEYKYNSRDLERPLSIKIGAPIKINVSMFIGVINFRLVLAQKGRTIKRQTDRQR